MKAKIGRLMLENSFSEKVAHQGAPAERRKIIDRTHDLPVIRQCQILQVARSTPYYMPEPTAPAGLVLSRRIDELHLDNPFAGSRMLRDMLKRQGHGIGGKHGRYGN